MKEKNQLLQMIFNKMQIQIEGQIISKELLINNFGDYINQTISKKEHNVGLVMHTGSICFDVILITYALILNLVSNKAQTGDVINSFSEGDIVLYGQDQKSRYEFKGIIDGSKIGDKTGKRYIKLIQNQNTATYVSEKMWRNVEPYNGDSTRMDGRGIRKKTSVREDFFTDVLGFKKEDIPSILDTSCVIVAPRDYVDYLVKNISYIFNEKRIDLLELVNVSYFTEDDEYRYGGNTGKNEPTIKLTSKVSVARSLLLSRKGNRHIGLIVLGEDSILRGYSELPELLNRRSLQYVYLCSSIDGDLGLELTSDIEDSEIFACTKAFLKEDTFTKTVENNSFVNELQAQINIIVDKNNEIVTIFKNGIETDIHQIFKKNIINIKRDEYISDEKDDFVMTSYSLMKILVTAPFPLNSFYIAKEKGIVEVSSPLERIDKLQELALSFPEHLQEKAFTIIDLLKKEIELKNDTNGKYEWLRNYLYTHVWENAVIVVPKAYYITILKGIDLFSDIIFKNKDLVTANKFDNSQKYERVIVLGDYEGKSFNAFRCNSASSIISVLYESEKAGYNYKKKQDINRTNQINKRSTLKISDQIEDQVISVEEENTNSFDNEIEEYIYHVDFTSFNSGSRSYAGYEGTVNSDIVAVAVFDDDTKAYFSKQYKGYVLEEETGIVKEVEVKYFCEGDSIVFTKNNDDTKDIVSSILVKLFVDGKMDEKTSESYRKANLWINSLVNFMNEKEYSPRKIAELMLKDGVTVHEQTIIHWLDEDSHTVGPRNVESIRHIGNITGVEELMNDPESIYEACREIRSIRRKILGQIGTAIVDKISGRVPSAGTYIESIFEKVDTLAEIKRVERIARVEMVVPMGMANRPISM